VTPKQQRFVEEYLVDLNATQAAVRAGYSAATASEMGYENLSKPQIAEAIAARRAEIAERAGVSQERIIAEFCRMGFYDPASIAGQPMTGPSDIPSLPEDVRRAIVGWGWDKAGNFTLKLADKNAALVNLGRHLGMFTDKVEQSGSMAIIVSSEDAGL
jgi:phage terminase small subunit